MPVQWNGTMLLYGRGYTPTLANTAPETAPRGTREWLLEHGYALAADSDIRIVNIDDDIRNGARVRQALEVTLRTPQGRAQVALAATLAQIPPWTDPTAAEPAGGVYSWNAGVDYRRQLQLSGRSSFVHAMYKSAGLDLNADLATLNAAPRIAADPKAVAYMRANYVPTGKLGVPVLTLQTIGDGLTVPATHGSLNKIVREAGRARQLAQLYVRSAGHCTVTLPEQVVALRVLEQKLDSGHWDVSSSQLKQYAADVGGEVRFTACKPAPLLRSCGVAKGSCAGEPVLR